MEELLYFLRTTLYYLLWVLDIALLMRALFSWFDPERSSRLSVFLYLVTEPIILPLRRLFERLNWFQGTPLDMPFLFTMILIMVIQAFV